MLCIALMSARILISRLVITFVRVFTTIHIVLYKIQFSKYVSVDRSLNKEYIRREVYQKLLQF